MGALLFGLSMCLTSCEDILGHWERPTFTTVVPGGGDDNGGGEGGGESAVKVTSITLSKTLLPLHVGDADVTLTATVAPDEATDKTVTWSSDKEAVATVDEAGKVHAVAIGTAVITATAKDGSGIKATCNVSVLPAGALAGVFSVSATKKVWFSQGNLQATYDGTNWTWAFATKQWNIIGDNNSNTSIDGNGTVSAAGTVDLFGWVGESNTAWTGAAQYGISNKIEYYTTTTSDYGNGPSENLKSDWGNTIATGWRTLDKDEWAYLFGRTVNGGTGAGKSYTLGKSVFGVEGIVLYPDNYEGAEFAGGDWTPFEIAGCVFLPAAGHRQGTTVANPGLDCHYWSSSPESATTAYQVSYTTSTLNIAGTGYRCTGHSVRLVYNAQ